jgi:hypothetical protein
VCAVSLLLSISTGVCFVIRLCLSIVVGRKDLLGYFFAKGRSCFCATHRVSVRSPSGHSMEIWLSAQVGVSPSYPYLDAARARSCPFPGVPPGTGPARGAYPASRGIAPLVPRRGTLVASGTALEGTAFPCRDATGERRKTLLLLARHA